MIKQTQNRAPVVVVLGHVDHGKSSILQAIKDFRITEKESGGITQHIGAYEIEYQGKNITFIDTPGHEAFSAMRSRGAGVADIAILVIAAEEGIKNQTKEAIEHIKEAGIPVIVAVNKIDKPEADLERVKRELANNDVNLESTGGDVPLVSLSAKTKKGIPELLEMILLITEMNNFEADLSKPAEGVVIEAHLDPKRGPTATLILSQGTLKKNNIIATSSVIGKVKMLEDFQGKAMDKAIASQPAVVIGFEQVPGIGEDFKIFKDALKAREYINKKEKPVEAITESDKKVFKIIIKGDVSGSIEAIKETIKNIPQEEVSLYVLKADVGEVNESDVKLASSSRARILAFRVRTDPIALKFAEREKIKIMNFEIIYELVEYLCKAMERSQEAVIVRTDLGKLKVLEVFRTEKKRQIVGGKVIEGEIKKGTLIEVFRGEDKLGQGRLIELQRNKKPIDQVSKNQECGILYEGGTAIEPGDILHIYLEEKKKGNV